MWTAVVGDERKRAAPGLTGTCPECQALVQAKCGELVSWHFAHMPGEIDCSDHYEPETAWHRDWKSVAPIECCEVVRNECRADVMTLTGWAVEFQRLTLPAETVHAREQAHGRVLWIVNAVEAHEAGRLILRQRDGYQTFRWYHAARWWSACRGRVVLDLGDAVFVVRKAYFNAPVSGWGNAIDRKIAKARLAATCQR